MNSLSWSEVKAPVMYNQGDIDYWKSYSDDLPANNLHTTEEVIADALQYFTLYTVDLDTNEVVQGKSKLYSYIIPLALDFLDKEKSINTSIIDAIVMQNL